MEKKLDGDLNSPVENGSIEKVGKTVSDYKPPAAYKPGVEWDGLSAEISEVLEEPVPNWDEILRKWGFDPAFYEPTENVKVSQWNAIHDGEIKTFTSYKGAVREKPRIELAYSYEDLVKEVKRHRKLSPNLPDGDDTFLVSLSDWQLAKPDGYGLEGTVKYIIGMIDGVEERIRDLRKIGRPLGHLCVAGLGDIIEGCDGNYSSQIYGVEVNRRKQTRIARRLIRDAICRWAKLFRKLTVIAVPGNQGENRKDGKMF